MTEFRCYYCQLEIIDFSSIIEHCVADHPSKELKYRTCHLNEESGRVRYITKRHVGIIPEDILENGKTILPLSQGNISIQSRIKPELKTESDQESETSHNDNFAQEELHSLLPSVIETLKQQGHLESYLNFNRLLAEKRLPMNNICYLLFLDLVEWFSVAGQNTSQMRYKCSQTVKFWQIGMKLFHGKFIRFMSGLRNTGQIVEGKTEKGYFDPSESRVNFVVPSLTTLHKNLSKTPPFFPGINKAALQTFSHFYKGAPILIAVDGKKISRGKGKRIGDIDCWGFESHPTLQERKDKLEDESSKIQTLVKKVDDIYRKQKTHSISELNARDTETLNEGLQDIMKMLANRNALLRETERALSLTEGKYIKMGGDDWRKSKYFPVISLMRVKRNEVRTHLEDSLQLSDLIVKLGSFIAKNQINFTDDKYVNLSSQQNFFQLNENYESSDSRFIKQRSQEWFQLRSESKVTGSTAYAALGLDTLKRQKEHYDYVIGGHDRPPIDKEIEKHMKYGVLHEIDAIATITSKLFPWLFPGYCFFEEGCKIIKYQTDDHFMVVSPDGSLRSSADGEPHMMYENKCKSPESFSKHAYYKIPKYYALQILAEMKAYECKRLLFTCWSEASMTAFVVDFDEEVWNRCWLELLRVYGSEKPVRPTRFSAESKSLRGLLKRYLDENVQLIGEFRSCFAMTISKSQQTQDGPFILPSLSSSRRMRDHVDLKNLQDCLVTSESWLRKAYDLTRSVAVEILVFMINDFDRSFHPELNISHPVAYAMKGSSMNNETFRNMMNQVIHDCEQEKLNVLATSSDGQWHRYGVRDNQDNPLTILQLQRDHWKKTLSLDKKTLQSKIKTCCRVKTIEDVDFIKDYLPTFTSECIMLVNRHSVSS